MKLFLCSHFSSVGSLIKEEIDNKKVSFIPGILLNFQLSAVPCGAAGVAGCGHKRQI